MYVKRTLTLQYFSCHLTRLITIFAKRSAQESPAYLTAEFWDLYAVHGSLQCFANKVQPFFWNTWVTE